MRTFTYVAGTSSKFWEVDRVGTSVTVRFGRIGTSGQTKTKDLGTDDAARDHVDKLVAEKVGKGYVEDTSAAPAAPPAAAKASRPKKPTPAPAPPAAEEPVESTPVVDEDRWEVPAAWYRQAEPWRGRIPGKPVAVDPEAIELAASIHRDKRQNVDAALDHAASDAHLVAAARLHRGTAKTLLRKARQEANPLGAAVLDAVVNIGLAYDADRERRALVDAQVAQYGLPFAVRTALHRQTISARDPRRGTNTYWGGTHNSEVAVTRIDSARTYYTYVLLARLRALLAAASDAEYAAAVAAAAETRSAGLGARIASSFLFPTEQAWVDADVALVAAGVPNTVDTDVLWASVATKAQADSLLTVGVGGLSRDTSLLYTAAISLGPDATDLLLAVFDGYGEAASKKRLLTLVGQFPTDEAFAALLRRLDEKYVAAALLEPMARFPRRAARLLAAAARTKPAATELLRGHLVSHPDLAAELADDPALASVVAGLTKRLVRVGDVDDAAVPAVLRSPPWEARVKRVAPAVLALRSDAGSELRWKPKERAEWTEIRVVTWKDAKVSWRELLGRNLENGGPVQVLAAAPEELVRPLLRNPNLTPNYAYDALDPLRKLLAVHGEAAVPYVLRVVRLQPSGLAPVLLPVTGPEVAHLVARWYARSASMRTFALSWLHRNAETAARDLLPTALGKPGADRAAAESALRLVDRATVTKAATGYGADAAAAIADVLDVDPLQLLPARMPTFPTWLDVAHLPQVLVAGRGAALPSDAVRNLVLMLMLCRPGEVYAGVEIARSACDPASLAEWVWGIFERWRAAEYPAKDAWVLESLAILGDDDTVRQLAPLIRAWPGEAAHKRAVNGLDVLRRIGTDVALMHLHRLAERASFKGLRAKAQERIAEIADDLGLSPEQLADRLVPDLGLDERGSMSLDYGARTFTVGFDEQLKPTVTDPAGTRRAVLPKPSAKDDPVLAPAAYARFSGLKKDVKTIAQDQIRRLERAMVAGRTWTADEHRALFVEHPLVWHLARRLVWRTADGTSFRVAEDRTFAGSGDDTLTIPADAVVSLAHPLHLDDSTLRAWSEVFADYEILQPFPQLAREVFRLEPAEKKATDLPRYHLTGVPTGRVLGLTARGWARGDVFDGGVSVDTHRAIGGGRYVVLDLDPGLIVGTPMDWPEQQITKVSVIDGRPDWGSRAALPLGTLDDVAASELIRDLEALKG